MSEKLQLVKIVGLEVKNEEKRLLLLIALNVRQLVRD
jgi:hypothetical protein